MTTQQQIELLVDLAKLFEKHGTESFERLADSLSSPEVTRAWVAFLRKGSLAAQESGYRRNSKQKPQSLRSAKAELESIRYEAPEKYETLSDFYDALLSKTVLPTLRDIRFFAEDNDLPEVKSSSRERALSPLVKSLIPLSVDEMNLIVKELRYSSGEAFNDLSGWSEIIMGKVRRY